MLLEKLVLTGVRTASEPVSMCPFHLVGEHRHDFVVCPVNSFPLFPKSCGQTMSKERVVAAYRGVVTAAGIPTKKKTDGSSRVHELFARHVCRVVGAVWLYSTFRELYLVQVLHGGGLEQSNVTSRTLRCTRRLKLLPELWRHSLRLRSALGVNSRMLGLGIRTSSRLLMFVSVIETTFGPEAPCVRNLASTKSRDGCVYIVRLRHF